MGGMGVGGMSPPKRTKQSNALGRRENWQRDAGGAAQNSERGFGEVMAELFSRPTHAHYKLREKPDDLRRIYGGARGGGVVPDFSITNEETGRKIFIEVKRQGPGGNAHERAGKYFAPGLAKEGRKKGKLPDGVFPFFLVFADSLASDDRYQREITKWFNEELAKHFLLWKDRSPELLERFFEENMRPVLDGNES